MSQGFLDNETLKAEEKRLYEEYKLKLAALKKSSKGKRGCRSSFYQRTSAYLCNVYIEFRPYQR